MYHPVFQESSLTKTTKGFGPVPLPKYAEITLDSVLVTNLVHFNTMWKGTFQFQHIESDSSYAAEIIQSIAYINIDLAGNPGMDRLVYLLR